MKNYVISLKNADKRRHHIIQEFGRQEIDFEFFDAVTPDEVPFFSNQLGIFIHENHALAGGEKACFLSHVCLWQKMVDDEVDYLAVFEDDAILSPNAHLFLRNHDWITAIPSDAKHRYVMIKIETALEKVHLGKNILHYQNYSVRQLKSPHTRTCGYILNQEAAKYLLNLLRNMSANDYSAIDYFLFYSVLKGFPVMQLEPAISIQSDIYDRQSVLVSQLESERQSKHKSVKNLLSQIYWRRTFERWYRSVGKRTFFEIVELK